MSGRLQRIANQNDGTRASGTPGFDASAKYVVKKLRKAGYKVTSRSSPSRSSGIWRPPTLGGHPERHGTIETATFDLFGQRRRHRRVIPTNDIVHPAGPRPRASHVGL